MKDIPLLTIVTVSYNARQAIENTILSVLHQTYSHIEYIIIDGGSTDGTIDVIKKYADRITYWKSEPDGGIYDAMNKGIAKATGEWLNFMNVGDVFANDDVLRRIFSMTKYENIDVIYGNTLMKYSWGISLVKSDFFSANDVNLPFCHQSTFVRTGLMKRYGFDLSYKVAADYNFFYNLYVQRANFKAVDIPIALYDTTGFSTNNVLITYKEVCRSNRRNHGLKYYWTVFLFQLRGLIKRIVPEYVISQYRKQRYGDIC